MFKLDQLDQAKACEIPYEFEVTDDATNEGLGIFLSVIGGHAAAISDLTTKRLQRRRVNEAMAEKADPRGKRLHVVPVEEDIDFGYELVAVRIVGWRGIEEPWSPENALRLCKLNSSIREQAFAKSEDMKNFPISGRTNSSSTSASTPG